MVRCIPAVCVLAALSAIGGCGSSGSQARPVAISGTVNLDGKPMPQGDITLIGVEGGPPATLEVKNGTFSGEATPGKKRVEIRANKPGKATKMGDVIIEGSPENYLPERFNTESTMKAEVGPDGTLTPNKFAVESR